MAINPSYAVQRIQERNPDLDDAGVADAVFRQAQHDPRLLEAVLLEWAALHRTTAKLKAGLELTEEERRIHPICQKAISRKALTKREWGLLDAWMRPNGA